MGMYNEIGVDCPHCSGTVVFQTKSGSCRLKHFHIRNVPIEEFVGIIGDTEACEECGTTVRITEPPRMNGTGYVAVGFSGEFDNGQYD